MAAVAQPVRGTEARNRSMDWGISHIANRTEIIKFDEISKGETIRGKEKRAKLNFEEQQNIT